MTNRYTVNAIKTFRGMEGNGFNCNLLLDGKKIALVMDDATGGEMQYEWVDHAAPRVEGTFRRYDDTIAKRSMTPNEAALSAYVMTFPEEDGGFERDGKPAMIYPSIDAVVCRLVDAVETEKKLLSLMKNRVVYVKARALYTSKTCKPADLPRLLTAWRAKFPEHVILNDKPAAEAIAIAVPLFV